MLSCQYCRYFTSSDIVEIREEGKMKVYVKYCRRKNRSVTRTDKACIRFNPVKIFYCDINNQKYNLAACINRHRTVMHNGELKNAFTSCKKCKQIREVRAVARSANIKIKSKYSSLKQIAEQLPSSDDKLFTDDKKPKLMRRKKRILPNGDKKPKLMRRRRK